MNSNSKNKFPGNDGLTIEIYIFFWGEIGQLLINSYNESFDRGQLSTSQEQAVITLLKNGKDRLFLQNWRPISLLNVDYKILTKVISKIKNVLSSIIHKNQSGFVPGHKL